jgi:phosphogluconate dehydratase
MPELHKLTPLLGVLQDQGFHVALVTDGRMSGASGKVPAAIHVTPECLAGGPLARVRSGDMMLLDGDKGLLQAQVADAVWQARQPEVADLSAYHHGMGRELFAAFRANALGAEQGAVTFNASEPQGMRAAAPVHQVHDHFVFTPESAA